MKAGLLLFLLVVFASPFSFYSCKQSGQRNAAEVTVQQDSLPTDTIINYVEAGQQYVNATQAVLAKNLFEAINKEGAPYALEFCNVRAYPITDSLARVYNAGIRRVTDKARNPDNKANDMEMAHITMLHTNFAKGEKLLPTVIEQNGKMIGYYPIVTNAMCLQCHGKPNVEITSATLDKIHALYPDDEATGYVVNELRGLWVVEMYKR